MDPSPDVLGAIFEYGGQLPSGRFGVAGVGYEKPALQVMFRGAPNDYEGPMTKCRIACFALAAVQPGQITGYLMISPQQPPHSLGKDTSKRFEIVCNFYITKEP